MIPVALTIAGSDSGGGAGIQADLKTFAALGVYGTSVVTAVTAQNTVAVTDVLEMPVSLVEAQLAAVVEDIGVAAAKTGMLASAQLVESVAGAVVKLGIARLVVDPVMVAKSGAHLLRDDAVDALRGTLLPVALIVTPNVPEAEVIAGRPVANGRDMRAAAREIAGMGPRYVVIKGGHLPGPEIVDLLFDGREFTEFRAPRVDSPNTHGTGCTLSAAIAASLARGESVPTAVRIAKRYVAGAVAAGLALGRGHGPLDHMWSYRQRGVMP